MGIDTICYGFNMEKNGASLKAREAGVDLNALAHGACATQGACNRLLSNEIKEARYAVSQQYGYINCAAAAAVVTDMAYNLGASGLS